MALDLQAKELGLENGSVKDIENGSKQFLAAIGEKKLNPNKSNQQVAPINDQVELVNPEYRITARTEMDTRINQIDISGLHKYVPDAESKSHASKVAASREVESKERGK